MNQTEDKNYWKCTKCGFTLTQPIAPGAMPPMQGKLRI